MLLGRLDNFVKFGLSAKIIVIDLTEERQLAVQINPLLRTVSVQSIIVVPPGFLRIKTKEFIECLLEVGPHLGSSKVICSRFAAQGLGNEYSPIPASRDS